MLTQLRAIVRARKGEQPTGGNDALRRADDRLRKALDLPVSVRADSASLRRVVGVLGQLVDATFVLDGLTGDDANRTGWRKPIRVDLKETPLRRVLDVVLKNSEMGWTASDGAIVIARRELLASKVAIRVYDVTDIPTHRDRSGHAVPNLEELQNRVDEALDTPALSPVARYVPIRLPGVQALAIRQTEEQHAKAATFLAGVRKAYRPLSAEELAKLPMLPGVSLKADVTRNDSLEAGQEPLQEKPAEDEVMGLWVEPEAAEKVDPPDRLADSAQCLEAAAGNEAFSVDLYKRLAKREGNVFFSPWSIWTAMAMPYAGARSDTATEIAKTMHYTLPSNALHPAIWALIAGGRGDAKVFGHTLRTSNRLWAQQDWPLLEDFTGVLQKEYSAEVGRVDFAAPDEAARKINAWVAEETNNLLTAAVDPTALTPETAFLLTNTVLFIGKWEIPFDPRTKRLPFYANSKTSKVPTMMLQAQHRYGQVDDVQVLEKSYKGGALSMFILLPGEAPGALQRLEESLSTEKLREYTSGLAMREVMVYLPKFRSQSSFQLAETLSAMGIRKAFDRRKADFTGISGKGPVFLSDVVHMARIHVFQEGTIAVAATLVCGGGMAVEPPKPVVFRADRPFVYLIRHNHTGAILFMGRLSSPTLKE